MADRRPACRKPIHRRRTRCALALLDHCRRRRCNRNRGAGTGFVAPDTGAARRGRLPHRASPARISCLSRNSSSVRSGAERERAIRYEGIQVTPPTREESLRAPDPRQRATGSDEIEDVASSSDDSPPLFPVVPAARSISSRSCYGVPGPSKPRWLRIPFAGRRSVPPRHGELRIRWVSVAPCRYS